VIANTPSFLPPIRKTAENKGGKLRLTAFQSERSFAQSAIPRKVDAVAVDSKSAGPCAGSEVASVAGPASSASAKQLPAKATPLTGRSRRMPVSTEHPLTARVTVNRTGRNSLARGEDDQRFRFARRMANSSEQLDWLACQFRDGGWPVRRKWAPGM
jgi:hypothetical protein